MSKPKALVLCGDGINCDAETAWALELAGFDARRVHTSDLLASPRTLMDYQMLALPGGFSFGDEIASGKILALKLKVHVAHLLHQFISAGNLVLGICNGFQVLTQLGLLPFSEPGAPRVVSLTRNAGGKFIDRWVELAVDRTTPCPFFESLETIQLPIRHGEGRLALAADASGELSESVKRHAVLRYREDVNGSFDRIAALTNSSGNVLGLMPHPEAFVRWTQHPNWGTGLLPSPHGKDVNDAEARKSHGLRILTNAAAALKTAAGRTG